MQSVARPARPPAKPPASRKASQKASQKASKSDAAGIDGRRSQEKSMASAAARQPDIRFREPHAVISELIEIADYIAHLREEIGALRFN